MWLCMEAPVCLDKHLLQFHVMETLFPSTTLAMFSVTRNNHDHHTNEQSTHPNLVPRRRNFTYTLQGCHKCENHQMCSATTSIAIQVTLQLPISHYQRTSSKLNVSSIRRCLSKCLVLLPSTPPATNADLHQNPEELLTEIFGDLHLILNALQNYFVTHIRHKSLSHCLRALATV